MTITIRGISTAKRDGDIDSEYQRQYVVTYLLHTDDWDDGPQTILDASGIPSMNDTYAIGNDRDDYAIVHSKRVTQRESPDEWEVEVTYKTASGDTPFGAGGGNTNPLDMSPKISAYMHSRNVVIPGRFRDPANPVPAAGFDMGVHISNGEHLDPPPEIEIGEPVISIQRNVKTVDWPLITGLTNCVNSVEFFGCTERQLRLCTPKIESAYDSNIGQYWKLSYELVYRFETWDVQILNRGSYYKDVPDPEFISGVGNGHKPFKRDEGHPFYGLLMSDGTPINQGHAEYEGIYFDGGDYPTFTRLRVYREVDFNTLGLL